MSQAIDTVSEQLNIHVEIECEHCEYIWNTESQMPRVTCPSCQRKTDRNVVRRTASIPTRYIGQQDSLEDIAQLYAERADLARELYERGWESNEGIDGPNTLNLIPSDGDSDTTRGEDLPPMELEADGDDGEPLDPSDGIGLIDYISRCPQCEEDIHVTHEDWDIDGKIVAENEVFCHDCEQAVEKNLKAIEFTLYPKAHFRHTPDLRNAYLKLRGTALQFQQFADTGWYLDRVQDQYVFMRYNVSDTSEIVLEDGRLQQIVQ